MSGSLLLRIEGKEEEHRSAYLLSYVHRDGMLA
jgi:hypothetical protein